MWFLFSLLTITAGVFVGKKFLENQEFMVPFLPYLENKKYRSMLGIVSIIWGVVTLIYPSSSFDAESGIGNWILIGDLLPATITIMCGIILFPKVLGYLNLSKNKEQATEREKQLLSYLYNNINVVGGSAIVLGIIHLFAATVPFF